ncbi:MAG: amidase family protein, partial [Rubrivivax sp.]|nr:amidase family protein [Rubrivivax sp.]
MSAEVHKLGVAALAREMEAGRLSSVEATQALLAGITRHAELGAFLAVNEATALAQAREADARRARGQAGALTGVPLAHKDIFV